MTIHEFVQENGTLVSASIYQKCFEIDAKLFQGRSLGEISTLLSTPCYGEKWNTHVRVWYSLIGSSWVNTLEDGSDPWNGVCLAPGDSIVKGLSKIF